MTLDIGIEKKICMSHSEVVAYKFHVCAPTNSVSAQIAKKMVDKFGGYRKEIVGPPGPQGPPGESLNARFFSKNLAQWFLDTLSFSCYFKDARHGLVWGEKKPIGIKNQVKNGKYATALKPVGKLVKIPYYGYGLTFSNSLYMIQNMNLAIGVGSKAILIFAFKIDAFAEHLQYIFHRENNADRAIYLKGNHLHIQASTSQCSSVEFEEENWNVCYIEFNNFSDKRLSYFELNNGKKGTFLTEPSDDMDEKMFLGGRDVQSFQGAIARIDHSLFLEDKDYGEMGEFPQTVRKSVLKECYNI